MDQHSFEIEDACVCACNSHWMLVNLTCRILMWLGVYCHEYLSQGQIESCKLNKNSARERKRKFAAIWSCAIPAEKCLSRALAVSLHSAAVWKTGLALRRFVSSGTCHTGLRISGRTCNLWCCSHSPSQPPSVPCWPPASCVKLQLKWRNGMGGSMPAAQASSAAYLSDGHPAIHPWGDSLLHHFLRHLYLL